MGILIKDMDFPEKGEFKHIRIYDNGEVTVEFSDGEEVVASAVPFNVPPHGELIDRSKISLAEFEQAAHDALHNGKGSILYDCGVLAGARATVQLIRKAPVIILED